MIHARSLFVDEILAAVYELSQTRTGALLILESNTPINERDFAVPGVQLDALFSQELLQTIFQPKTSHNGAVVIRGSRIVAAEVIFPIAERTTSRQLRTRNRAAMGITERVNNCICIVVSGETGSISFAENGVVNQPLTITELEELLRARSPNL